MGRDVVPDTTVLANVDAPVVAVQPDAVGNATEGIRDKVLVVRYAPSAPPAAAAAGLLGVRSGITRTDP
jgi:hypothetical protein